MKEQTRLQPNGRYQLHVGLRAQMRCKWPASCCTDWHMTLPHCGTTNVVNDSIWTYTILIHFMRLSTGLLPRRASSQIWGLHRNGRNNPRCAGSCGQKIPAWNLLCSSPTLFQLFQTDILWAIFHDGCKQIKVCLEDLVQNFLNSCLQSGLLTPSQSLWISPPHPHHPQWIATAHCHTPFSSHALDICSSSLCCAFACDGKPFCTRKETVLKPLRESTWPCCNWFKQNMLGSASIWT